MQMNGYGYWVVVFVLLFLVAVGLTRYSHGITLDITSGPERSLVMVRGSGLELGTVIWDAGTGSEKRLPGGFLGAYMFSVPPGAALGSHPVAIEKDGSRSPTLTFTVTAPQPFGKPRIDHVMLFEGASFTTVDGSPCVTTTLLVQGANIDVGAVVRVRGEPQQTGEAQCDPQQPGEAQQELATFAYKGLRNDLHGVDPKWLGYPIYHYVALYAAAGTRRAGSKIVITVKNLDDQESEVSYQLPESPATLDSDGDSLPDVWETNGYDANGDGTIDTHPHRRDILLEIDVMDGVSNPPIPTTLWGRGTFDTARDVFAAAPIMNPVRENGINLIIDKPGTIRDASGNVRAWDEVRLVECIPLTTGPAPPPTQVEVPCGAEHNDEQSANFGTLKAWNFDHQMQGNMFHYAIWANSIPGGYSGESDFDYLSNPAGPGDDFIVSLGDVGGNLTARSRVEVLVHELGHNLGQRHGGDNNSWYKPNYLSVMSYAWLSRSGDTNEWRRKYPTCPPFYYAAAGVWEPNGARPWTVNDIVGYSEGMAADLKESSLDEQKGVCGQPVDWNRDDYPYDVDVQLDADQNGDRNETLKDFANWRALRYDGPALNGKYYP